MVWLAPVLVPSSIAAISVLGLLLFRRWVHPASLSKHNDTAGAVFSIIGTLFTVLLAFVVIVVWEAAGAADDRAALEAGVLGDAMRDAGLFADPERSELQNVLREYAVAVIDEEWPAMAKGESSPRVWNAVNRIFQTFSRVQPATPREINIHAEMLTRINELSDHRRLRLLSANNKVPPLMWAVLGIGGVVTIAFSYCLGVESRRSHMWMTGALALMIGLTLHLIVAIDHPFGGIMRVEPDAFHLVLDNIRSVDYSRQP